MSDLPELSCEEFYFRNIAPIEASPQDYREFFGLLWRAHGEVIYKHAYARLGDFEDARDVCQDAFVRAMQYIQKHSDRIPVKVNFRGWLRLIVRHLIIDRFRRMMVRPEHVCSRVVETAPVVDEPEADLIRADDVAVLRKCLAALTENARTLVTMCDLEGLSQKAAAEKVGSTPNAVGVALHRARKALRECVIMSTEVN